ncbi:MAG: efflux transporter outer membrane subunit [Pseudomonadota bacterium]
MRTKKILQLIAGLLVLALQGCSLAPRYVKPETPPVVSLPASSVGGQQAQVDPDWRDYFTDQSLQKLITDALTNNRDLRQTALNVESYQAQYRIQRAALFPAVSGAGSAGKQRAYSGGRYVTAENYAVSVGVTSYELDFFGRVKNLQADALEQYLSLEESYRSVRLSLIAEVARAYLTFMADRELLSITEDTLQNQEESYRLVELRAKEGIATQLALAQSRTALETARGNRALYRRQVAQDLNSLALLTGGSVPELSTDNKPLSERQPFPVFLQSVSSEVLLQRPDILAAEHMLKGAHANIGAARAAFFPIISLSASAGVASGDLADLFGGGTGVWAFSPSITVPIFNAGRLNAQLDVAEVRKNAAIAKYELAIQTAFREAADVLVAQDTYREQLAAQKANLQANQEYYTAANERYQEGLDNHLTFLDAQRSLYTARQSYIGLQLAKLVNQVNLYKVFGGGRTE